MLRNEVVVVERLISLPSRAVLHPLELVDCFYLDGTLHCPHKQNGILFVVTRRNNKPYSGIMFAYLFSRTSHI